MPHVTALVHLYPPTHNAGAEWMLHSILTDLISKGWTATVVTNRPPRRHDFLDGVEVLMARDMRRQAEAIRKADVCITHLDATRTLIAHTKRRLRRPVVHLVHNDAQLAYHHVEPGPGTADLVVFNSEWIQTANAWPGPNMVVHPPVWLDRYTLGPEHLADPLEDRAVTLLNLAERKGSKTFYELARRFPDTPFLGVRGAYAHQDVPTDLPSNVMVRPNHRNVRFIYGATRVLLMPSHYESWGRCAVEAAVSGIPTIAGDTPGLEETGVPYELLDPLDVDAWEEALRRLLTDPDEYALASVHALARAEELEAISREQMADLDTRLRDLAGGA